MKVKIITVETVEDLRKIRLNKNDNVLIILKNDLDFEDEKFLPINADGANVILHGHNHTISNISLVNTTNYTGIFRKVKNLYVRNIYITDLYIAGKDYVGALAGDVEEKIDVKNTRISGLVQGEFFVGGVCGSAEKVQLTESRILDEVHAIGLSGGVVGYTDEFKQKGTIVTPPVIEDIEDCSGYYYGMVRRIGKNNPNENKL